MVQVLHIDVKIDNEDPITPRHQSVTRRGQPDILIS